MDIVSRDYIEALDFEQFRDFLDAYGLYEIYNEILDVRDINDLDLDQEVRDATFDYDWPDLLEHLESIPSINNTTLDEFFRWEGGLSFTPLGDDDLYRLKEEAICRLEHDGLIEEEEEENNTDIPSHENVNDIKEPEEGILTLEKEDILSFLF